MSFFNGFPFTSYKFGNETDVAYIQDISAYVDIIDQVKENVSIYQKYDILDGERPDVLSEKLYGSTKYYWTFYLMNDSIRKNGFPLSSNELDVWVKKKYPNTTLVTRDYFFTKMQIGDNITGVNSSTNATIIDRDVNLGHIVVSGVKSFTNGETIQKTGDSTQSVVLNSHSLEYNAVKYFTDASGNQVDIDPTIGGGSNTEVTHIEHYHKQNNENKSIRVVRPEMILELHDIYKSSLLVE
tara:strand:- start:3829 stop:4548 length:720 start_codon:yes stop_codon:yes gene_type:complete